ncbi:MAG: MgtC/SapB family protein [Lewinellaceae bacterium]|nr:MgtC/SapB family protein [Lewinellaceae bacterium]
MDTAWLDFLPPFFQGLLVATGIGLIMGLEREHQQRADPHHFAGLRTFPLVSITGFVVGMLSDQHFPWLLPAATLGVLVLVSVAYYMQARQDSMGLTTEFALVLAYALGILVAANHHAEALSVAVAATVLLSLKERFQWFVKQISQTELVAFIKFFVLVILLLLLLPNQHFGPDDILHYRDLGWTILLVSSISFAGYLLLKFTDSGRGILLTAVLGGLFSSTMIAWIFGARSREMPALSRPLGAGILLASSVMYVRVLLLAALFSTDVAWQLALPCGLMLAITLLAVWYYNRDREQAGVSAQLPVGNPLDLKNAVFFGFLYIAVTLFMHYSRQWFGESGSYFSGIISGLADMDAITISTAKWAKQASAATYAANVVLVAALSNTFFKAMIAILRGHPAMRRYMATGFGAVLLAGGVWLAIRLL